MIKKSLLVLALCLLMYSFTSFQPVEIPYGDNREAGHYITLNGVRHYYEVYGEGRPMLMIHGNRTALKAWALQIPYFAKKYKVYAIDCRGRGKTDFGPDSLSFRQIAADMAAFIRQMKLDSVDVVGRSDGGVVALLLGIYYPSHIRKIVAFGANLQPDTNSLYPETVEEIRNERRLAEKMMSQKDSTQNWYVMKHRNRMMEYQPNITAEELRKIRLPVLVMSCDRDVIKEEHTLFIYRNILFGNLCILPDEVHRITALNPDLFNSTVDTYLSRPYRDHSARFKR
jgi:pimeloyl-ACP methyl ester carboxylesterase